MCDAQLPPGYGGVRFGEPEISFLSGQDHYCIAKTQKRAQSDKMRIKIGRGESEMRRKPFVIAGFFIFQE